jgi:uncharacterized protein (DUF1697 family)
MSTESDLHVALLRGVNVGGKNRLAMKDLARVCEGLGCRDVRTYLQSGNVVYRAPPELAGGMQTRLRAAMAADLGLDVPVVTRDALGLRAAVEASPFIARGLDPATVHVMFLAELPEAPLVAALDRDRSPGDAFEVHAADVHLHLPNGVARSKLTNAWFDARLRTVSTVRNWNTVTALAAMVS